MVERIKFAGKVTVQKLENIYAVLAMVCLGAAVAKLAVQPKVHSSFGLIPAWQIVAGILGAGLSYTIFQLIDKE